MSEILGKLFDLHVFGPNGSIMINTGLGNFGSEQVVQSDQTPSMGSEVTGFARAPHCTERCTLPAVAVSIGAAT